MTDPTASVEIAAPLDVVWRIMLDTESYASWNPFVVRADTPQPAAVGNPIVLHVVWETGSRTTSPERITALEKGDESALLSYVYEGLPSRLGLVRGVRHQRLTSVPGGTRYDTVEEFSGPLVFLAGPGRVQRGFERHAQALKTRAEREVQ